MIVEKSAPDVVSIWPFVPAKDLEKSLRFYVELGFTPTRYGSQVANVRLGAFGFLLQKYDVPSFAENYMMQMTVNDLEQWWQKIANLDLATKYGVQPPKPPALQPWGLRVAYLYDPTGVLWHLAQNPQ